MRNKKGFTLVELLAVIVVLAIVMLVVADRVGDAMLKSRGNSLVLQVKSLGREVEKIGAMENRITTDQINKIVTSGDLTYLGYVKAGTKIGTTEKAFKNDAIVVQAAKGSKFSNIAFTKDIEGIGTLIYKYDTNSITLGNNTLKNSKNWLRQPIIYFETTVPIEGLKQIDKVNSPVDITENNNEENKQPSKTYNVGDEVTIGTEKFNVIKDNGDSVTMFAKNVLSSDGITQIPSTNENEYGVSFADEPANTTHGYWTEFESGKLLSSYGNKYPANVYNSNSNTYNVVNTYVKKLKRIKKVLDKDNTTLTGRLIYISELVELGYAAEDGEGCLNKENAKWITNGQYWWTGSANNVFCIGFVNKFGNIFSHYFWYYAGVRPVITIDKKYLN